MLGPASPSSVGCTADEIDSLPVAPVELVRRRVDKQGRVKQKLSVVGVRCIDCAVCMSRFRVADLGVALPRCLHVSVKFPLSFIFLDLKLFSGTGSMRVVSGSGCAGVGRVRFVGKRSLSVRLLNCELPPSIYAALAIAKSLPPPPKRLPPPPYFKRVVDSNEGQDLAPKRVPSSAEERALVLSADLELPAS